MLICDLCDNICDSMMCDNCGFDNSYQDDGNYLIHEIIAYMDRFPNADMEDIMEAFGLSQDQLKQMVREYYYGD